MATAGSWSSSGDARVPSRHGCCSPLRRVQYIATVTLYRPAVVAL